MEANEFSEEEEEKAWNRLVAEQFLAGYAESDSIYDNLLKRSGEDENVDKITPENG